MSRGYAYLQSMRYFLTHFNLQRNTNETLQKYLKISIMQDVIGTGCFVYGPEK